MDTNRNELKERSGESVEKAGVKVCGLTRAEDARLAADLGAAELGFIFYGKSPRGIDFARFRAMREELPEAKRVFVQVNPEPEELRRAVDEGFDFFQLHFGLPAPVERIAIWSETVSPERLWLAPKIPPGEEFPVELLPFADHLAIDTYRKDAYGGTGETGDWGRFREWSTRWPEKRWILMGGLSPENVVSAIAETGTRFVDVSSRLESRPGVKDPERMRAFFAALRGEV